MKRTVVYKGDAAWSRKAYLTIEDDTVEFDCSDGEYGPIRIPLQTLIEAIDLHTEHYLFNLPAEEDLSDWDNTLLDGLEDEDFDY
jgi:hypothetical protein